MNRLTNYWTCCKLAKITLAQAEEDVHHKNLERAVHHLVNAVRELMTANNNLASIAFNRKPKARKP